MKPYIYNLPCLHDLFPTYTFKFRVKVANPNLYQFFFISDRVKIS